MRKPTTIKQLAAWIDRVGFALLFPKAGVDLPSVHEVAVEPESGWGLDMERVWKWKDQLPAERLAWSGHFLRGQTSFLALDLLADLYPGVGDEQDVLDTALSPDARRIGELLLVDGPTSTAELREATGLIGKKAAPRFSRAVNELERSLLVTHDGTQERRAGWPSVVLELTARAFPVPSEGDAETRRRRAAARFMRTMPDADPATLARAFGWRVADARVAL